MPGKLCTPLAEALVRVRSSEIPSGRGPRKRKSCGGGAEEGCSKYKLGGADLCGMVTVVTGAGITRVSQVLWRSEES